MTLNNDTEKLTTEVFVSAYKPKESKPVEIDFDRSDIRSIRSLIEGIAEAVQAGRTIDLPLFIRDLKSAIVKEIDRRRVNQTKASERLCLNRGSYRKYLARALQKTGDTNA